MSSTEDCQNSSSSSSGEEEEEPAPPKKTKLGPASKKDSPAKKVSPASPSKKVPPASSEPEPVEKTVKNKGKASGSSCKLKLPKQVVKSADSNSVPGTSSSVIESESEPKAPTPSKKSKAEDGKLSDPAKDKREDYEGMSIILGMSNDDMEEFLKRIDLQSPIDDIRPARMREKAIDWNLVEFSHYGQEQCKLAWKYLHNNARKFRIMHEVVEEIRFSFKTDVQRFMKKMIESAPDFPKQPYATGGFHVFCKGLWDKYKADREKINAKVENFVSFQTKCREDWNYLSEEEKEEYNQKAKLGLAEYRAQVKEYYAKFPCIAPRLEKLDKNGKPEKGVSASVKKKALLFSNAVFQDAPKIPRTPLQLYVDHKLNQIEDVPPTEDELGSLKSHYVGKWKMLSDKKKLKWIDKCVKKSEIYIQEVLEYKKANPLFLLPKEFQISKLLSKEEFYLWSEKHGHPPNPKSTAFDLFLEEFKTTEEAVGTEEDVRKLATDKWEQIGYTRREMYKAENRKRHLNFQIVFEEYFKQIPYVLREWTLNTLPKKFSRNFREDVNTLPLVLDDEQPSPILSRSEIREQKKAALKRKGGRETDESQEEEAGTSSHKKKKKKKKAGKAKAQEGDEQEPEPAKKNDSIPLYMTELTEEHIKMIEQSRKEREEEESKQKEEVRRERRNRINQKAREVRKALQDQTVTAYAPGTSITQQSINEAIRGFFDGRHVARRFSVYYFYARHVAETDPWIKLCQEIGVVHAALRLVETFHRLPLQQKQIFLDEALAFHNTKRHYAKDFTSNDDLTTISFRYYPEEPKPPPRNAVVLYQNDVKMKKKSDPEFTPVPWAELDEKTQILYLKKLHHLNKVYFMEYEEFVRNMRPNDMVEYLIQRCHNWDVLCRHRRYRNQCKNAIKQAADIPIFRTIFSAQLSDDGQESEPELYKTNDCMIKTYKKNHAFTYKENPFSVHQDIRGIKEQDKNFLINRLCEKRVKVNIAKARGKECDPKEKEPGSDTDSDLPSSSDEEEIIYGETQRKLKQFRQELRERQRYYYPLQDLTEDYQETKTKEKYSLNSFWWSCREGRLEEINRLRTDYQRRRTLRPAMKKPVSAALAYMARRPYRTQAWQRQLKKPETTRVNLESTDSLPSNWTCLPKKKKKPAKKTKLKLSAKKKPAKKTDLKLKPKKRVRKKVNKVSPPDLPSSSAPDVNPIEIGQEQSQFNPSCVDSVEKKVVPKKQPHQPALVLVSSSPLHSNSSMSKQGEDDNLFLADENPQNSEVSNPVGLDHQLVSLDVAKTDLDSFLFSDPADYPITGDVEPYHGTTDEGLRIPSFQNIFMQGMQVDFDEEQVQQYMEPFTEAELTLL